MAKLQVLLDRNFVEWTWFKPLLTGKRWSLVWFREDPTHKRKSDDN